MKILLDEQVPEPVLDPLGHLLRSRHTVDHDQTIGWKRKKDIHLLPDLAARGYHVLVTADLNQLYREDECKLIHKHGFHHVRFKQVGTGVTATASAIATIVAGLPAVLPELECAESQRLVLLKPVRSSKSQFEMVDPRVDPPPYWFGRGQAGSGLGMKPPRQRGKSVSSKLHKS
ncbi:PIN-like domain-containing protein [Micromonospora craniellae]|uniref:VapC45 PIN like domain-containing protein n=1 Tax=Micromonospora craniellae TaxID=2294034 RepID=A0A372FUL2_9ACTN|nr:hypothetical protein [Micromonospora craniellae]QOC92177.1 hypothetical protein ID554_30785 [Micromonospora craniellae]RFS44388.1 hypothetical protein D0Q02_22730 [Micromonospora craniellae]